MTKIQLRRDTATNWSTNNPTPSAGEPCFETDTGKLKIGDGITAYNSLPYQGGTGDVSSAGNNNFTGTNIFKGISLNVGDDNGYANVASLSGETYIVGDQEDTTIYKPLELGASFNNTVLKSNVKVLEYDSASVTKKAYSIMTKSTKNNEYMGHMAMPSDKYIDLELGASGTTYTAPADGYYRLTMKQSTAEQYAYLASYTTDNEPILSTTSKTATGTDSLSTWIAVHKGQSVKAVYNAPDKRVFRFIYAIGSEPST
nr:MAG TPA: hyaluronidase [Caudoviricetes sp.]